MKKLVQIFIFCILLLSTFSAGTNSSDKQNLITKSNTLQNTNSSWNIHNYVFMDAKVENGSLYGEYLGQSSVVNEWRRVAIDHNLTNSTGLKIDLDFEFNFPLMGQIDLSGSDNNGTTPRWVAGYSDAWSGTNGVPFTLSYQSNGTLYPQSFPITDPQRDTIKIATASGFGHISIVYTPQNTINATVTVPGEVLSTELPLSGSIDTIRIGMQAAGAYNTPSDLWLVDNYTENTKVIDSFDSTSLNSSLWTKENNAIMGIIDQNGVFTGYYTGQNSIANEWRVAYAFKNITNYPGLKIDLDFSFNFPEMGQIDLFAFDNNGTTPRWVAGYSDAWTASNGAPFAHSYQSDGTLYPQSFPTTDPQRNTVKIATNYGTGHISLFYISNTEIFANVTVPGENIAFSLPVSGSIDTIRLYMQAAGAYNTNSDLWIAKNYQEVNRTDLIPYYTSLLSGSPFTSTSTSTSSTTITTSKTKITTNLTSLPISTFYVLLGLLSFILFKRKRR